MYLGGTTSVSGFLTRLQLFGVSLLIGPSPMLEFEGIGFGWAPIGLAVKSFFRTTMSSRRLLLTYSNSVGYSCDTACCLPVVRHTKFITKVTAMRFRQGTRELQWLPQVDNTLPRSCTGCGVISFSGRLMGNGFRSCHLATNLDNSCLQKNTCTKNIHPWSTYNLYCLYSAAKSCNIYLKYLPPPPPPLIIIVITLPATSKGLPCSKLHGC